jgi:hypothetical protein
MLFSRHRLMGMLATVCALALGACMLFEQKTPPDGPKEYPIAAGRYYRSSELDSVSRDSALQFEDYGDSGTYAFTSFSRPGCKKEVQTGIWYARISGLDSSFYLRREGRKFRQVAFEEDCLTSDSLISLGKPYMMGQYDEVRNITDSSFETCQDTYRICYQLCETASQNPDSECYRHQSTPADSALWVRYVK